MGHLLPTGLASAARFANVPPGPMDRYAFLEMAKVGNHRKHFTGACQHGDQYRSG